MCVRNGVTAVLHWAIDFMCEIYSKIYPEIIEATQKDLDIKSWESYIIYVSSRVFQCEAI